MSKNKNSASASATLSTQILQGQWYHWLLASDHFSFKGLYTQCKSGV